MEVIYNALCLVWMFLTRLLEAVSFFKSFLLLLTIRKKRTKWVCVFSFTYMHTHIYMYIYTHVRARLEHFSFLEFRLWSAFGFWKCCLTIWSSIVFTSPDHRYLLSVPLIFLCAFMGEKTWGSDSLKFFMIWFDGGADLERRLWEGW